MNCNFSIYPLGRIPTLCSYLLESVPSRRMESRGGAGQKLDLLIFSWDSRKEVLKLDVPIIYGR